MQRCGSAPSGRAFWCQAPPEERESILCECCELREMMGSMEYTTTYDGLVVQVKWSGIRDGQHSAGDGIRRKLRHGVGED
jgi:hypothetical protein